MPEGQRPPRHQRGAQQRGSAALLVRARRCRRRRRRRCCWSWAAEDAAPLNPSMPPACSTMNSLPSPPACSAGCCCRYGQGDAVSQWHVDSLRAEVLRGVDSVTWFKASSLLMVRRHVLRCTLVHISEKGSQGRPHNNRPPAQPPTHRPPPLLLPACPPAHPQHPTTTTPAPPADALRPALPPRRPTWPHKQQRRPPAGLPAGRHQRRRGKQRHHGGGQGSRLPLLALPAAAHSAAGELGLNPWLKPPSLARMKPEAALPTPLGSPCQPLSSPLTPALTHRRQAKLSWLIMGRPLGGTAGAAAGLAVIRGLLLAATRAGHTAG